MRTYTQHVSNEHSVQGQSSRYNRPRPRHENGRGLSINRATQEKIIGEPKKIEWLSFDSHFFILYSLD